MTIGIAVAKTDVDRSVGYLTVALLQALNNAVEFKTEFLDKTAASTAGVETYMTSLGYTAAEITTIRNHFTFLQLLQEVANGGQVVPNAVNFFSQVPLVIGVNVS